MREALRTIRDLLTEAPEGVRTLPYLPELPARGPGTDMIGRTASLLVDLPVDLQPQGWRMVDRPGLDAERSGSWWRQDLDELAEAFDGWAGPLKLQVAGPWTLAAALWLPLGDRILSDAGATRDVADSLAEGVRLHLANVARLVPGAQLTLQVDEPTLPDILLGHIRSDSGYRVLPTPDQSQAEHVLGTVLAAARDAGATTVVHCCGDEPPVDLLRGAAPDALALDLATLTTRGWDAVATSVEAGVQLWAGVFSETGQPRAPRESQTSSPWDGQRNSQRDAQRNSERDGRTAERDGRGPQNYQRAAEALTTRWHELGLAPATLGDLGVTPACGLAGATPAAAQAVTRATIDTARALAEAAEG